ncbi:MAG: hypothetical protein V4597_08505 [Pseudomonadota bacterium]
MAGTLENLNLAAILSLAQALGPVVEGGVAGVEHVIAAIKGVRPEAEIDDDLRSLIQEALAAKAEADAVAAGQAQAADAATQAAKTAGGPVGAHSTQDEPAKE